MWVLGGICRETKEVFLAVCPDNRRDKATLLPIIKNNVSNKLGLSCAKLRQA